MSNILIENQDLYK